MIAFEVYINGKKKCTAGIREPCVLTAALSWVVREPGSRLKRRELNLGVGGLGGADEQLQWMQRDVQPGDEVTIRIIETAKVDKPKTRQRLGTATPAQIRSRKKAYLRKLAKEFGWKIQTK